MVTRNQPHNRRARNSPDERRPTERAEGGRTIRRLAMHKLLACQKCRAENAGVVAQGGSFDADLPVGVGECLRSGRGADELEIGIAEGPGHSAADDHDLGPEGVDQASQPDARGNEPPAGLP